MSRIPDAEKYTLLVINKTPMTVKTQHIVNEIKKTIVYLRNNKKLSDEQEKFL